MDLRTVLVIGSSLSFLFYGMHCLTSQAMNIEFQRYGVAHLRVLTGVLEILGGAGLIVGLWWPLALRFSSGGLTLLMLFALVARFRVRDPLWLWLPALVLLLINAFILARSVQGRS